MTENVPKDDVDTATASKEPLSDAERSEDKTDHCNNGDKKGDQISEYSDEALTNRNKDFTSEEFKLELHGIPKYFGVKELRKLLNNKLELNAHKIKPASSKQYKWIFLTFKCEEERQKALQILDGYTWKNKATFSCKLASGRTDPILGKRKSPDDDEREESPNKKPIQDIIKHSTCPYADMPYPEQLDKKKRETENIMKNYARQVCKLNPDLVPILNHRKSQHNGLPCEVADCRPSPQTKQYRNKCEFTIGVNPETDLRTIGFRVSSYKQGSIAVSPVQHLDHISDKMKEVITVFEEYLRSGPYESYNAVTHSGHWRQLTVRTTTQRHLMLIVVLHPQQLQTADINTVKEEIKELFTHGAGKHLQVTSLYFQSLGQRQSGVGDTYEHLYGDKVIIEKLRGITFKIGPDSFFQVNTGAAEVLYDTVGELAKLDKESTLLDICCGTGTIGIYLSKFVGEVLGVELVEEAVECAKLNTQDNNIINCQFFAGKAEVILSLVTEKITYKDNTIAVVDPPRAGLHNRCLSTLRKCESIKRLVYVSCDVKAALQNFVDLARPYSNTYQGDPFIPVKVIPVDLFPDSYHHEVVILFERFNPDQYYQSTVKPLLAQTLKNNL